MLVADTWSDISCDRSQTLLHNCHRPDPVWARDGVRPVCGDVATAPQPVKDRLRSHRRHPSTMIKYLEFAQNRAESAILTRPVIVPSAEGGVANALAS